jgi:hypothetical protein
LSCLGSRNPRAKNTGRNADAVSKEVNRASADAPSARVRWAVNNMPPPTKACPIRSTAALFMTRKDIIYGRNLTGNDVNWITFALTVRIGEN